MRKVKLLNVLLYISIGNICLNYLGFFIILSEILLILTIQPFYIVNKKDICQKP